MSHTSVLVAGRYQLHDRIAAGGMGEVWRALDTVLERPVAVKLLRAAYAGHSETLARFRAEARHAAALSHPGIAQVYDYGETGHGHPPYLVMELVDGPALTGLLARGPLDAATTIDIVAQAAAALAAAHSAGLVHRDIKPGNLLVGPGGQLKITDFGIAHAAGSAPITRTGTLVGTPAYLAPERVAGGSAGPASDLYSLGIVAWECLAGFAPFSGMEIEVALAHRDLPLPPLPRGVPAQVAALIAELAAKDPAARPATAGQVARRAGLLREALGPSALAGNWPGSRSAAVPRTPTIALADADRGTLANMPLAEPPLGRPRSRRRRPRSGRVAVLAVSAAAGLVLAGWLLNDVLGSTSHGQANPSPPAHSSPAMVAVSPGALVGQPVYLVRQQLQQLGLQVQVTWQPAGDQQSGGQPGGSQPDGGQPGGSQPDGGQPGGGQQAGTVTAVRPSGLVPVGSTIYVTAAFQGQGHGDGNGNGNGNGHGGGGGD